ncbi:MAG: hypothetical protein ACOYM3_33935, partial [Terrimicrobiaceae bacterium]
MKTTKTTIALGLVCMTLAGMPSASAQLLTRGPLSGQTNVLSVVTGNSTFSLTTGNLASQIYNVASTYTLPNGFADVWLQPSGEPGYTIENGAAS